MKTNTAIAAFAAVLAVASVTAYATAARADPVYIAGVLQKSDHHVVKAKAHKGRMVYSATKCFALNNDNEPLSSRIPKSCL